MSHITGCPANDGELESCFCDDAMIAAASLPSPAELLRRAKEKGWHQPVPAYGGEAGFPLAG